MENYFLAASCVSLILSVILTFVDMIYDDKISFKTLSFVYLASIVLLGIAVVLKIFFPTE